MVHKNLERPEGSVITFNLLNESEDTIISKKAGYHHHGDTLPLLIYRSEWCLRRNLSGQCPSLLLRKRGLVGACLTQTLLGTSTANWKLYMSLQIYHIY